MALNMADERLASEAEVMNRAVAQAARAAHGEYVRFGHPIPVWREGHLVWVSAADLVQLDTVDGGPIAGPAGSSAAN